MKIKYLNRMVYYTFIHIVLNALSAFYSNLLVMYNIYDTINLAACTRYYDNTMYSTSYHLSI